jgi:hypothetical protein
MNPFFAETNWNVNVSLYGMKICGIYKSLNIITILSKITENII